jgi:flagellar biosynthetic protein FlhB
MAEQEKDKTQQATPYKLQEAARRGQVAKSLEFNSFAVIAGLLAVLYMWGEGVIRHGLRFGQLTFSQAGHVVFDVPTLMGWFHVMVTGTGVLLAPFFFVAVIVAIGGNMVQTGPIFSSHPLKPDLQRLNPVSGFKRIFSMKILFEAVKSVIKLLLFSMIAYMLLSALLPTLIGLMHVDPKGYTPILLAESTGLIFKLAMAILIVAALDFAYTRWDFSKKMMMSNREVKEEVKRREGDPLIRAKQRELQKEAAKRAKSASRVPEADVLITNPTHYAIALRYVRGSSDAPVMLGKGSGALALAMRRMAERHAVPIFERRTLARQLFIQGVIDAPVPNALYEPVARVYADLYEMSPAKVHIEVRS